jgi:mRNA interferase MazF
MKRGDIYLAKLNTNHGNIQEGIRPVIIISNDTGNLFAPTVIVCALTSANKKPLPTHLVLYRNSGGLTKNSIVLCEQIFTMNKEDLIQYVGRIPQNLIYKLNDCLKNSLGLLIPKKEFYDLRRRTIR